MCQRCDARARTRLPRRCHVPPVPFPPVKKCPSLVPRHSCTGPPTFNETTDFARAVTVCDSTCLYNAYTRAVPRVQGDEILKFWELKMWWILGGKCSVDFPTKNRLNLCHRKLHHILHCNKRNLSTGTHYGSILA